MNDFMQLIYGVLFCPTKTFRAFEEASGLKLPILVICIVSLFIYAWEKTYLGFNFFDLFLTMCTLLFSWLLFAFFVDLLAKIFRCESFYKKLLSATAYSFLPWIFLAPINLLKNSCDIFQGLGEILLLVVWIWTIALQVIAISEIYKIKKTYSILIFLLPFLGFIIYIAWVVDFFRKITEIFVI